MAKATQLAGSIIVFIVVPDPGHRPLQAAFITPLGAIIRKMANTKKLLQHAL
ncbi:MAG: hypothetical protein QF580_00460 [Gammaproteobacteria bacterium]|jgi:hypothetical protein|nr:hypothetical protein [Gammaproteobacteria bacterium]